MRLKVSNVCQLLGGSRYYGDNRNGIKITNNGDGTFTVNGTATNDSWFLQPLFQFQTSNPGYHTYLLDIGQYSGNANAHGVVYFYDDNVDSSVALIGTENSSAVIRKINGPIAGRGTIIQARFAIVVLKGVTVTNWTIRPQLFDLTEMYGAGNEPTTVAQFRQDFPNEMYEYSPECWKKFRRLKYVTETKNLFDISKVVETNYVKRSGDGLICSLYGTPIGKLGTICPSLKVGDTVTVSFKTVSAGVAGNFIQTDNHILRNGEKFTVSETGLTSQFYLYNTSYDCRDIPNKTTYYELQLEKGSTASPYQPYGYLPLNRGKFIANKEPVQLLDKSNYEVTSTNLGITWTNNGDGTITANGNVVSGTSYSPYRIFLPQFREVKNNHKYALFSGINNINVAYVECLFWLGKSDGYYIQHCVETNFAGTFGFTIPQGEYLLYQKVELRVRENYTANNLVFKPQLFDLTEMYGAGNEPTTVAQFRADFPNELYGYNPYNAITFR